MQKAIEIPIELFLKLYNTSADNEVKNDVLEYLKKFGENDPRAHHLRGFYLDDESKLGFSEALYSEAVSAGKIGTYSKGIEELAKKVAWNLDFIHTMHEKKLKAIGSNEENKLERLLPIPDTFAEEEMRAVETVKRLLSNASVQQISASSSLPESDEK